VTIPGLGIQSIQDRDRDMDGVDPIIGELRRNVHDALSGNDAGVVSKKRKLGSS
jgi:hypothetical protein